MTDHCVHREQSALGRSKKTTETLLGESSEFGCLKKIPDGARRTKLRVDCVSVASKYTVAKIKDDV